MQGVDKNFGVAKNLMQKFNYFTPSVNIISLSWENHHDPGKVSEGGGRNQVAPPHYSNAADEISIGKNRVGGKNLHRPVASAL